MWPPEGTPQEVFALSLPSVAAVGEMRKIPDPMSGFSYRRSAALQISGRVPIEARKSA
jgi:hypothetical protein